MDKPENGEPVTTCIDVYKENIKYYGSLEKPKLRTVVRGHLQRKYLIGDTWSSTASMRTLKYFLEDAENHKARVHHLGFWGAFLQAKVKLGICEVGQYICGLLSRIFKLFWKSLEITEIYVWND